MNISVLTDPNPKNYLDINCHNINNNNIVCNDINCNNVDCNDIVSNDINSVTGTITTLTAVTINNVGSIGSLFKSTQSGTISLTSLANTTNVCDIAEIPSSNYNLSTNVFTVPKSGRYQFIISCGVSNAAASQSVQILVIPVINGNLKIPRGLSYPTTVLSYLNSINVAEIYNLILGNTVSYQIVNANSTANTIFLSGTEFSGYFIN